MRRPLLFLSIAVLALGAACGDPAPPSGSGYAATGQSLGSIARPSDAPNLIVLVIDSLREDAISTEGRMPYLQTLASDATTFTEVTASASWTLPSMTSLLTGRLPSQHGLTRMEAGAHLLPDVTTFAEILRQTAGYDTAAFVSGPWFDGAGRSILQGFETVGHDFTLQGFDGDFDKWVRFRSPSRPFFLLLHSFDTHMPYGAANRPYPPRPYEGGKLDADTVRGMSPRDIHRTIALDYDAAGDLAAVLGPEATRISMRYCYEGWKADPDPALASELEAAYWNGVAWTDGLLAGALVRLDRLGLMRNTVLVVTSDHGESFGEHGTLGHGLQLHDELVHVPMVVKGPAPFDRPRTVDAPIALNDLLPTFLDRVGLPPLPGVDGRSALPVLRGDSRGRAVVSEEWLNYENTGTPSDTVLIAARSPSWKYYAQYDRKTGMVRESAYDLAFDPGETQDLAAQTGTVVGIPFDDLLCPAVEKIRDLLWGTRRDTSTRTSTLTIPYATRTAGPATPRPRPCGIEIR